MTHPTDNRPPPKEPTDDAARNRGDAHALATAPGEADTTAVGAEGVGSTGPQNDQGQTADRELPAPALSR